MPETKPTIGDVTKLLRSLAENGNEFAFDEVRQSLTFSDDDDGACELTLPRILPKIKSGSIDDILRQINQSSLSYSIILIQAGAASIGLYERGELLHHRVIRKYMVRKKQGKSQIKHLKSKGKSRLGSRIRLQNSITFFEDINQTLEEWDVSSKSETILMSLPINLKNLLFTSNIPVPFDKKDPRIVKVPVDVRVPSFKELLHVNWIVTRGTIKRSEQESNRS